MQNSVIDGVTVYSKEGSLFSAALMFGVGRRDESFVGGGITHLVEHLTMATLSFTATGRPEAVGDFISSVAAQSATIDTWVASASSTVVRGSE